MEKKILETKIENEVFEQIKTGDRNTLVIVHSKQWLEKLAYPCGTFKKYDLISIQNIDRSDASEILVEFKGVEVIKEKPGWLKTKKHFEINLGEKVSQ